MHNSTCLSSNCLTRVRTRLVCSATVSNLRMATCFPWNKPTVVKSVVASVASDPAVVVDLRVF